MAGYSFCRARTLKELRESVNRELGNGYELVGGPFVFKEDGSEALGMVCQAVFRDGSSGNPETRGKIAPSTVLIGKT